MNKELKRYVLAEYSGYIKRMYNSKEEYNELIKKINKYNSNKKNKKLYGNVTYTIDKDNKYHVIINCYKKLTPKMTISEIDNLTLKYENEKKLIKDYSNHLKKTLNKGIKPLIRIVYLEDKNSKEKTINDADRCIRNIDVLYNEDLKYMSYNYLKLCIKYYVDKNDYGFFLDMANTFESNKSLTDIIEKIRITINESKNKKIDLKDTNIMDLVDRLYYNHIAQRNDKHVVLRDENGKEQVSRRRKRDFSFFVRNYNIKESKRYIDFMKYINANHEENIDSRIEKEEEFIEEEEALNDWDQGRVYKRK